MKSLRNSNVVPGDLISDVVVMPKRNSVYRIVSVTRNAYNEIVAVTARKTSNKRKVVSLPLEIYVVVLPQ